MDDAADFMLLQSGLIAVTGGVKTYTPVAPLIRWRRVDQSQHSCAWPSRVKPPFRSNFNQVTVAVKFSITARQ